MTFLDSLGSAIIGTAAGHWSAKQNAKIQRDQWVYQQSNAHQLEVQDLKNAGLNPILSATHSQLASMPQVTDNGLGSSVTSALSESMSRDADRGLKAEVSAKELENEKTRLEIEKMKADWFGKKTESDIKLNAADIILKKANSDYLIGETSNSAKRTNQDIAESKERIKQIQQDIDNSIEITKATVAKYGADAEASRAIAAQAYSQCKLILERTLGQQLDNQQVQRILDNPKAELDADTWDYVKSRPFWSSLYSLGQYVKEISPFGNASLGYHRSNQSRSTTSVSTIDHNYNHSKK